MKLKRLFALAISLVLAVSSVFALERIYDNADEETKAVLAEVDKLIEAGQYQSAWGATYTDIYNEYIITKRVELVTQYFSYSLMHQMFGFSNLKEGESLAQIRHDVSFGTNEMSFSMIHYDPVEVIESYVKENGPSPVLDWALAAYYEDVKSRYGNQWLITYDELTEKTREYYGKAFEQGVYTEGSLSTYAYLVYESGNLESALQLYQLIEENGFEYNVDDFYNMAAIYYQQSIYDRALSFAEKSIAGYQDDTEYQADSYNLAILICLNSENYKKAESLSKTFVKKYGKKDYRANLEALRVKLCQGNPKTFTKPALAFFDMAPENPKASTMIMDEYYNTENFGYLKDFFDAAVKKYSKNTKALENIYFHYSSYYYALGDAENASKCASIAKDYFIMNGTYTDEIKEMIEPIINKEE